MKKRPIEARTIDGTVNPAVLGGARTRNNGRYNGRGRDWATPPEIFDPLDREFHFTLDPCASPTSAKCARFFTEADNGLAQSWRGERVFLNPPSGREIYAWTHKARTSEAALVVGLLPASTDLAWWHDDVIAAQAEIRYLRGRVRFLTGGPYRASGFFCVRDRDLAGVPAVCVTPPGLTSTRLPPRAILATSTRDFHPVHAIEWKVLGNTGYS
jgi:site-specific DNA-methyltransferase (adenine-specific)